MKFNIKKAFTLAGTVTMAAFTLEAFLVVTFTTKSLF